MRARIVFMGTPQFAVRPLEACFEVGDVAAAVCQPDKPKGRGQAVVPPPVKVAAQARGARVLQPAKLKGTGFSDELRALAPDVVVVAAYGKILPPDVLAVPPHGCVNVHASLLPRFRGAAPIQWAIASGDERTGVCLMKMDVGLDTGPVISCREKEIRPDDTSESLHEALSALGAEMLRQELPRYLAGELSPTPQPGEGVVLAPMIQKEQGLIDWARPALELERRLRAFTPWPGAFTSYKGGGFKVHRAKVAQGRGAPGELLAASPDGIEIACGQGSLLLLEVQPEGKRRMTAAEFLAGNKLERGARPFGAKQPGA